jgi:hypothetical protein
MLITNGDNGHVYGCTCCDKDDQSLSPLTLRCGFKQTLIDRWSPPSAIANDLTIQHKQQKLLFCSKAQ